MGDMGGFGWLGAFFMVLVTVGLVALVVWVVAGAGARLGRVDETAPDGALDTLKRRYAQGAITRDQYLEGRKLLGE